MSSIRVEENVFEPALLADEELTFLLDHLEQAPVVALHKGVPKGVHPLAITNVLTKLQELEGLASVHQQAWAGFDAIRDSILRYLAWRQRSQEIYRRTGGPRSDKSIALPSQYAWDSSGSAFRFGIEADSAEMVRTEILDDGTRRPFGVRLLMPEGEMVPGLEDVAPWVKRSRAATPVHDTVDEKSRGRHGSLTCSICDHAEAFDGRSRMAKTAAVARMRKHLKTAREDVARHRLLYRKLYESPTARA